ncbi:Rab3 GTPase-activating protein catalytic subunit-like protein [Drosera capensis]
MLLLLRHHHRRGRRASSPASIGSVRGRSDGGGEVVVVEEDGGDVTDLIFSIDRSSSSSSFHGKIIHPRNIEQIKRRRRREFAGVCPFPVVSIAFDTSVLTRHQFIQEVVDWSKRRMDQQEQADAEEDQEEEEELERFDDFTLASSWERFISDIEAVIRHWLADGPKNLLEKGAIQVGPSNYLFKAKTELKHDLKSYIMEYYFFLDRHSGKAKEWEWTLHDLQLFFGVDEFLVIAPQSANGVVLDSPEASKLLSAVAIASSNCSSFWPAFVPVHDPSRKAFIGIQNTGTVFTRRFEGDRIGSQAFSSLESSPKLFSVQFTMKLTYKTLPKDDGDNYMQGSDAVNSEFSVDVGGDLRLKMLWDDDCPWSEWYSAEDPVQGFELTTLWPEKTIQSSLEMAEVENSSPHEAQNWLLVPEFSTRNADNAGCAVGFASQLSLLVKALVLSFEARFVEDFVSVEAGANSLKSSSSVPPPSVVDRVLKEIFHEAGERADFSDVDHISSRAIKGAPVDSLFAKFCLHSLWLGGCSIRAIAVLWIEFVRGVRCCWEESQPLPKMRLAICIDKKREANQEFYDANDGNDQLSGLNEEAGQENDNVLYQRVSTGNVEGKRESKLNNRTREAVIQHNEDRNRPVPANSNSDDRRGSAGFAGSLMLLNSYQRMHSPFTQDPPLMTEDMHEERLRAVETFSESSSFSAQLEREILLSDMSAFKAANPGAAFEDFIRWHSPGDWESHDTKQKQLYGTQVTDSWPPTGRLSKRMSDQGNFWRALWNEAPALPAYDQKPLLDPNREGEKVVHYLETLRPHQLLEQMVCCAFRASADTLNKTAHGNLTEMRNKLDQLDHTMASMLRPLQVNQLSQDSEVIQDLQRLCVIFEHVEELVHLAASLHRKLLQAPRLSRAIFSDYYKSFLPRMGNGYSKVDQGLGHKQQMVRAEERHVVVDLFTPPNSNQSWRKVLSMGNLLNGHEPAFREVIFRMRESASRNHYAAQTPRCCPEDLETYRMYIRGTSNDLEVALSVVSCD